MNLKNYTSGVSSDVTIARIERCLADAGATGITKQYEGGVVVCIVFEISFITPGTGSLKIRLPANVDQCREAFWRDHCRTRSARSRKEKADFTEQAVRTAWKLTQDWVEVQMSLIRLKQIDTMQAFLAYVWDGRSTLYEKIREGGFKALLPPPSE